MKILLGGVPFGGGNLGDEAILNCVIKIFRRNFPGVHLAVGTFQPEQTSRKYQVETLPAFGFAPQITMRHFRNTVKKFDMFVWAGGTGLSEYPQIGADLLENAQKMKVKTVIWQVGMNREFNPEYFQLHGRKLKLAEILGIARYWEKNLEMRMRERLQICVSRCDLVVLRDQPSLIELHNSGEFPEAFFGADSVILQQPSDNKIISPDTAGRRSIGVCIAEKLNKYKFTEAVNFFQRLQQDLRVRLIFIPMTDHDRQLMEPLHKKLSDANNIILSCSEPEDVQNAVSHCSLLISGRLQLTIMGLNALVPGIGIANSSKIANCLNMFGLPVFNNQSVIDFNQLFAECRYWLEEPEFAVRASDVRSRMLNRLEQCEGYLRDLA